MIEKLIPHAQGIALIGFFLGFLFIVFQVARPSKRAEMERNARIPLKGE